MQSLRMSGEQLDKLFFRKVLQKQKTPSLGMSSSL